MPNGEKSLVLAGCITFYYMVIGHSRTQTVSSITFECFVICRKRFHNHSGRSISQLPNTVGR